MTLYAFGAAPSVDRIRGIQKSLTYAKGYPGFNDDVRRYIAEKAAQQEGKYFCFDRFSGIDGVFYINRISEGMAYFTKVESSGP